MRGKPSSFWGKLSRNEGGQVIAWHPLVDHCADVAACCEALLERTLLRRRLAALAGLEDLDEVQCARLCVLSALHDVGKFNLGFQRKADPDQQDVAGHVGEVFALLSATRHRELDRFVAAIGGEEIARWGAEQLLYASLAHHGKPVPFGGGGLHRPALWVPEGQLDPFTAMGALATAARRWFPEARDEGAPFTEATELQHAFSGLVTLADWLGSDEKLFPFSEAGDRERITSSRARAREALRRIGLDTDAARAILRTAAPTFQEVFDFPPRAAQKVVAGLALPAGGGLEILEAETGSGKTEAALARFLALFTAGRVDGLYFALPTRTAATQMHDRIAGYIERAFPDRERRPPVVLAVPGYLRVDAAVGTALAGFQTHWPDDDRDRWRFRGWAAERPKRFLAGAVSVGTIDQALLGALAVKHAHLRATSLFRQLLVVDEVHASDAYMNRILEELLARHLAAGGHALLMSATLGSAARTRFLARGGENVLPKLEDAKRLAYPLVTTEQGKGAVAHFVEAPSVAKSVEIRVEPMMEDASRVAGTALEAARRGARVLVIRNTVRGAVATQEALEAIAADDDRALLFSCAGKPAPHHSRFTREDRTELDHAIQERFGKGREGGACVAIATQTVQQSLDLDADLLLTDLCPMDVLLQRIGRLHRHAGRTRAPGFASACAIVLVPAERDLGRHVTKNGEARGPHGIGTVYPDLRILEATWRVAAEKRRFDIPAMNRELVEQTTHPTALDGVVAELGGHWIAHAAAVRGIAIAHGAQANVNLVDWSKPFVETAFPDADERVSTRLGAGDRIAQFADSFRSPFAKQSREIPIPASLAKGAGEEEAPTEVTVSAEAVRFRFGKRRLVYDRLGLRTDAPAKEEEDQSDA